MIAVHELFIWRLNASTSRVCLCFFSSFALLLYDLVNILGVKKEITMKKQVSGMLLL